MVTNIPQDIADKIMVDLASSSTIPIPLYGERPKSERFDEQLRNPRGKGKRMTDEEKENLVKTWKAGTPTAKIAKMFNTSVATVYKLTKGIKRADPENI